MKYVFSKRDAAIVGLLSYLLMPLIFLVVGISLVNVYGDEICEYFHVTNFEGGQGYFFVYTVWPLTALVSTTLGALVAVTIHLCCFRLAKSREKQ